MTYFIGFYVIAAWLKKCFEYTHTHTGSQRYCPLDKNVSIENIFKVIIINGNQGKYFISTDSMFHLFLNSRRSWDGQDCDFFPPNKEENLANVSKRPIYLSTNYPALETQIPILSQLSNSLVLMKPILQSYGER